MYGEVGDERRRADHVDDVEAGGQEPHAFGAGVGEAGGALGEGETGEREGGGGLAGARVVVMVVEGDGVVARSGGDGGGAGDPAAAVELAAARPDGVVAAAGGKSQIRRVVLGVEGEVVGVVGGVVGGLSPARSA